ncbi:non-ribosomal peptide synthetase, partial [Burkholderia pseudomallei]|uniref:non-ribosomal peptide synthetase n=2 Tax=Burkholderia pseudomallei TaxID=28450 RepID=UPI0018A6BC9E
RVKPPRSTAHPPLFQVMFVWQNAHEGSLQIPGLRLSTWGDPLTMAPFELTLAVREHQDDIACTLTYATSLFDRATVERYLGHWLRQLDAMATDADPVVTGLPLLGEAERAQVLHGWNETGRAYARDACLHQLFEAQVSRTPEAAAVICGDETLSYTDLDARANRLAHYLRGQGVGPDTRVGLALGRGVEMMTGLLAVLKAGGAYVPLDPGYASERLRAILDDSRPAIVLADAAGRTALDALAGAPPIADLQADASRWSALPSTPPRVEGLTPRHLAYVIYTSGSTGQPKGVMVEHASVVNLWRALDEAIYRAHPSARRVSLNASIAFDSLVKQWVQLLSGRTLVVVPEPVRFDGRRLLDAIGRDRIDVFDCTPSQLALIEGARGPEDEAYPQVTLVGGEAIGEGMWSELASASSRTYYNVYGPTECTVDATLARITAEHAPHIGGPLANVRAYVLNERLSPAPVGVRGELYIGGAGVARGYLNRPELTRERFIDDPFVAGGRLYKTGDLARWRTDGSLEYLGRNDFQVKIRGFRIELGEIEAQLAKVTGVREVVVLARDSASAVHDSATEHAAPDALSPSPETSTATAAATATATATATEKRLVAYYTGDADVAALRAQAAQHLPSYMVPSAYVRLDAWPLTPNGKLDRRALPAPADDAYARAEYEAPQGAKEEALAEIWRDLLQVDRISRHDNFFQLGGHSLLAISLGDMMRERGLHADVRTLFNAETLAALAAQSGTDSIDVDVPPNLIPVGAARITPDMLPLVALTQAQIDAIAQQVDGGATNVQDIYPLAPLQEGMLFHHLLHTQGDLYLEPHLLAFRTRERLERFLSALQCVIDRHDVLRTGFFWEGVPQPVQVVWRRARLPVEYVELPDGHGDVASQLEARCDPRRHRIDIGRAPLVHCHVAHDARNDRWVLGVLTHHLVSDHTTLALLAEEAQAFEQGRGDALPPAVPFRNFVAHARLGTSEREHEAFFREMLGDVDEPTAPFGLLDVQGDGSAIVEHRRALAPGLSRSVRAHARRLGVSAASVMHVAWSLVLARTANRRDVVFGTVLFGRMQGGAHAHRTMGLFMNTLPVRIALDESDVETSLIATHDRLARLLRHEHAPLALAQRCSAVPAQAPLFTSLLNYRYSPHEEQGDATDDDVQFIAARERNNYPLTMIVDDTGEGFALTAQVDASIDAARFDGRRLLDAIGRDRIDVFDCTPSQLALIEGARGPEDEAYPQVTLVGGEAIGEGMWSELASASSRTYYNVYGPTECTVDATLARITAEHAPHIGGPLANVRAYVLNERLSPAPVGVRGELYIGGAGVARGYLNRPELTRERFIDDPFVAGGRLYRTGDLARWRTDGKLEYLGRNDFQVKIRGFRIELGEIEAQLAKVAGVREVVVLARDSASEVHDSATEHATPDALSPSPETSTATATATATEKRLVAYYTGDADVVALRAQAAQHLPSYMVPSAYVRLDAWPLTPNGKLDRRALPAPADDAYARAEYEAPQGAKEEALAAIWRELLHVERVSRHDNFFELGGHSLLAVQLVSRLRQALSVEVALSTVFDAPVLSALAERLEAGNTAVLPPIPLTPRDGRIALSLAQQRLWFLTQLEGVSEAYHMSGAVRLDGLLNREVLQRALNRIVMRHEALRTCFVREEGEPIQVIQPHADLTVSYHDLREAESIRHEAGNREQRAKDLSQAHASAPFDLSRDLPVRVLLLQL